MLIDDSSNHKEETGPIVRRLMRGTRRRSQLLASGDRSVGKFHQLLHFTVDNGRRNGPLISVSERATLCTFISAAVGW